MDANNKTHAKDYLLQYITKSTIPLWLSFLVKKCIELNGNIPEKDKDNIFSQLLQENRLDSTDQPPHYADDSNPSKIPKEELVTASQQLVFKKITHIKGVNALIPNQSINFSPACTIIFGLNGTGKSGYFRIIHELAGGAKHKSILNNIRGQENGLEVNVEFNLDDNTQNYIWQDKYQRGIVPFNKVKVFDSEYLPIFLNERENSVNIEPLGLNLFHAIALVIDEFKLRLEKLQQEQENAKPDLQPLLDLLHLQDLKELLQQDILSDNDKQLLDNYNSIFREEITKLANLKQQKQDLEKQNTYNSKKLLNQEKIEVNSLKDHLAKIKSSLESLTKEISEAITDYASKKKARDNKAKQFELLRNVPSHESEEWQSFIKAASDYGLKIDKHTLNEDEKCIYCHQPLSADALNLVKTYAQYLSDQSQNNFTKATASISILLKTLKNLNYTFNVSEILKPILIDTKIEQGQDIYTLLNQILSRAEIQKTTLIKALEKKEYSGNTFVLELFNIETILLELFSQRIKHLNDLGQSENKKLESIIKLGNEIKNLEDKENISKWKIKIDKYFVATFKSKKYAEAVKTIHTRGITELGSKAHDELLTDSIRKSFENELRALGKDIEITLEKTSAGKGTVRTCLKILGNDVQDILSDGEQKAVCLSLFLGEIESQQGNDPIVFDDPVTSVDHEVADLFAKRLVQISTNRQVVIFTHNKLFYDSLFYWCGDLKDEQNKRTHHICKNYIQGGCNTTGCHVYTYTADRESKDRTGRIYERQNESCNYFITKAEGEMKGSYTISSVAGYLKSAIEHYIDEEILKNQGLLKDRRRKISIQWDEIKKIDIDEVKINKLRDYWDQLSDRGSHSTQNSQENPLKAENLLEIIKFLKNNNKSIS